MMKQIAFRLPTDVYEEFAKRASREGRKVTPYIKQVLLDVAKSPPIKDCIIVHPTDEMRWALVGIARELNTSAGGILLMAADKVLNDLVAKAVDARELRKKASEQLESGDTRQSKKSKSS